MESLGIGFSNFVNSKRVVAVVSPESNPIKRIIQKAKEENNLVDVTFGRKTRSVIVMDSNHVVLSCLQPETLQMRIDKSNKKDG